ncbi:hypothetical protein SAMN05421664_2251 [Chryseobacterium soldanellicola]|uniref:AIR9-like A9 domain-containing protein n=1 Tax=Chryseobacterium soldanellicola TaxID=311333 RepID=A0A1H1D1W4_9FLAO|nr:hypothetical protein [Chryseobacterium soldanellicola]SDQ70505.1 hypothetical protein SAMN05421664_2251 [Chryseobacterium soldanellicola]
MTKKLFTIALITSYTSIFSQVGINTQNPDPSAVLDVSSDTKGILVPRLSSAAVSDLSTTASEGLIVYNKEQKAFLGWDGVKWQNLGYEEINTVPAATNLSITGTYSTGSLLTANYTFSDAQSNPDDASTFVWKRADTATGANTVIIPSAASQNYTLVAADQNKYIQFCVTPGSSAGASPGNIKCSAWGGPVSLNQPPTASNVNISGTATQGQTLTGVYTYNDSEGNAQGTSTFRWTRSDDASGTNETPIAGANTKNYSLTATDVNKYIKFYVTPIATTGTTNGSETGSPYKGPIAVLTLISGDVFNEGFESGTANGYFALTTTSANTNTGVVNSNSASGWSPANSPRAASGTRGYQFGGTASASGASAVFISPVINATQYTNNMTFSMKVAAFGTASGAGLDSGTNDFVLVEVSSDGGSTYSAASVQVGGNSNANWAFSATGSTSAAYGSDFSQNSGSGNNLANGPSTLTITGIPNTVSQLRFRITVKHNQTAAQDEYWVVDDIKLVAP